MSFRFRATRRYIEAAVVNPWTFNSSAMSCHTFADLHGIPFINNEYYTVFKLLINCLFCKQNVLFFKIDKLLILLINIFMNKSA